MHNRTGPRVESRELSLRDAIVLVPLVLAIIAISVYPQFLLARTERTVAGGGTEPALAETPATLQAP